MQVTLTAKGAEAQRDVLVRRRAQQFLEQVMFYDRRVEALLERVERSRARLERVSALYGERRNAGQQDWTDLVAAVIEDDRRLNEQVDLFVHVKEQVRRAIREIGDAQLQALLEFRYMSGLSWQQVANRMYVDRRTISRLHAKALRRLRVPEEF